MGQPDANPTRLPRAHCAGIVVAGGSGQRAGLGLPKQYAPYRGTSVLGHAAAAMREKIDGPIVIVVPSGDEERAARAVPSLEHITFVSGGKTRQESVRAGLEALATTSPCPERVLIHDAARPDLPASVVDRLIDALSDAAAAIPVLPVADSMISAKTNLMDDRVARETLRRVQTPQAFDFAAILRAHRNWEGPANAGDDAEVFAADGGRVVLVDGDERLAKLTYSSDFGPVGNTVQSFRIGSGYDVHRLVDGDGLWLCGIRLAHDRALSGHSDADVALHALTDAILGAIAAGDIGQHFPPSDDRWRGASSDIFLTHAVGLARDAGYEIGNLDLTIICERPRIGPHVPQMRSRLAELVGADIGAVSVKATTTERLGFTGRDEGIAAQAHVLLAAHPETPAFRFTQQDIA